jgi:hypothetical protein
MFMTPALDRGVAVKGVAEWQGHKNEANLILDTHIHVNRGHSKRIAELMSDEEPENVVEFARNGMA